MKKVLIFLGVSILVAVGCSSFYLKQINDDYRQCIVAVNEVAIKNSVEIARSYCGVSDIRMLTTEEQYVCRAEAQNSTEMTENQEMRDEELKKCEGKYTWFYKFVVSFM